MTFPPHAHLGSVQCACTWRGTLPLRRSCPACGRDHTCRVSPQRLAVLQAIAARGPDDPPVPIEPMMRRWLVAAEHRLIEAAEPPPSPDRGRRARRPVRAMRLTALGHAAVITAASGGLQLAAAEHVAGDTVLR